MSDKDTLQQLQPLKPIEVMKFLGIMAMVTCHCFFFLHRFYPQIFQSPELTLYGRFFYFMGFGSMMLPAIAGVAFRDTIDKYIFHDKIRSFPSTKLFQSLVLLAFLDSFKTALTFSYANAFKWDVLHFIALCFFLLTMFLKYFSVFRLLLLMIVFLALAIFEPQKYFSFMRSVFVFDHNGFHTSLLSTDWVYWLMALVFAMVLIFTYFKFIRFYFKQTTRQKIVSNLLFLSVATYLWVQFLILMQTRPLFLSTVWNLPLSVFIQMGQVGGHIWPLFPWFVLVAAGFVLRHFQQKIFSSKLVPWLMLLSSGFLFFYFIFFQLEVYQKLFTGIDFFGSSFFQPNAWLLAELCLALIFLYSACEMIFRRWRVYSQVIRDFSDGILFVYLGHFFLAYKLMPGAVAIWPSPLLLWFYPFFIMFLTYCFLVGFLAISNKMIWFRLQKK